MCVEASHTSCCASDGRVTAITVKSSGARHLRLGARLLTAAWCLTVAAPAHAQDFAAPKLMGDDDSPPKPKKPGKKGAKGVDDEDEPPNGAQDDGESLEIGPNGKLRKARP